MERRAINPWTWQDRLGFVQANEIAGGQRMLFCAGQVSVDENGALVHAGDMAGQIGKALENLETVLKAAGMDLSNVVRLTYFTTDVDAFRASRSSLARLAEAGCRPASALLGVQRLAFPELMVEIEATAVA